MKVCSPPHEQTKAFLPPRAMNRLSRLGTPAEIASNVVRKFSIICPKCSPRAEARLGTLRLSYQADRGQPFRYGSASSKCERSMSLKPWK